MNKKLTTLFAVIGAICAIGALLYFFRDKLCGLCKCCKDECCCGGDDEDPKDAVEEAKENAAAVVEEFNDYAD